MSGSDASAQDQLRRLEALFHAALDRPVSERDAFLDHECYGDAELRRQVEGLLGRHRDSSNFMRDPVWRPGISVPASELRESQADLRPGDRVGCYRLLRRLGVGGMGAVWLAERDDAHYSQRVALKIIKRGLDTDDILRRFRHERQVLASLEHPNIARLLDGGATGDGRPYLVMEYVDGQRIDAYCDRHHLSIKERLQLFLNVCAAVRYAHQNLIVHRDLKPGNILATEMGEAKLVDFGISRVLETEDASASAGMTAPQRQVLTPRYASPEQIRGECVTTASDVYSLGVVLYELLTGREPYGMTGLSRAEVERVILDTEPNRPSSVRGDLNSEIDAIVLKSMAKDVARRYQSLDALMADVERYLAGEAVLAHPPGSVYRLGKLVKRHRLAVAFAATVFVLVLVFGIVSGLLAVRLDRQQQAAERRFDEVRGLARTMIYDLHDTVSPVKGTLPAREMIVATGLHYLDVLAREAGDDVALQLECAAGYFRIADIQGNPSGESLGQTAAALESCQQGLLIVEPLLLRDPSDARLRLHAATGYLTLANLLGASGQTALAIERYEQAITLQEQALADEPEGADQWLGLEKIRSDLAACLARADRFEEAEYQLELVVELIETRLRVDPSDQHAQLKLANTLAALGNVRVDQGNMHGAREPLQTAIEALQHFVEAFPDRGNAWRSLAVARTALGRVYAATGESERGREALEWAVDAHLQMIEADPSNVTSRRDLGAAYHFLGQILDASGDTTGALAQYEAMIDVRRSLAHDDPSSTLTRREFAVALDNAGAMLRKLGRLDEALEHHLEAKETFEQLAETDPENVRNQRSIAVAAFFLGQLYRDLAEQEQNDLDLRHGYRRDAVQQFRQSKQIMETLRDTGYILPKEAHVIEMLEAEIASCEGPQ